MNAKPLFIIVMLILFIALFVGAAIGDTDLTPDTPPAPSNSSGTNGALPETGTGPVTGSPFKPCGTTYMVREGDTLSSIAQSCNLSLAALMASNPSLQDPNLIKPGQQLNIDYGAASAPAAAAPAAVSTVAVATKAAAVPGATGPAGSAPFLAWPTLTPTAGFLASPLPEGLRPGGSVHVTIRGLPPSTLVEIGIGKVGNVANIVDEQETDKKGELVLHVAIPKHARAGEQWQVTVTSASKPRVDIASAPFVIEE